MSKSSADDGRDSLRQFGRYLLWQAPGWVLIGLALALIARNTALPAWGAVALFAVVILRDLALYPAMRSALGRTPYSSAPIGAVGEAVERLQPVGYIRVNGELWRAEIHGAAHVPPGTRVRVRRARGLTLLVDEVDARAP